jgi:hypothetical protein
MPRNRLIERMSQESERDRLIRACQLAEDIFQRQGFQAMRGLAWTDDELEAIQYALRQARFSDHLNRASKVVSRWPEWKQRILG